jgi:hypothetical protein
MSAIAPATGKFGASADMTPTLRSFFTAGIQ